MDASMERCSMIVVRCMACSIMFFEIPALSLGHRTTFSSVNRQLLSRFAAKKIANKVH
jgi:hypothetical protein